MQDAERELKKQIEIHFDCDKRYIKLISRLIIALLKLSDSKLSKWSKGISGEALLTSKYRCLQRFLSVFRFGGQIYFAVVWGLYSEDSEVYLSLDRTEWKMRGVWVQVLMLSILHDGVSIPLLWQCSSRHGHSSQTTKKALFHCLKEWISLKAGQQVWLCADREFGSKDFFEDCKSAGINACVRLKKSTLVRGGQGAKKVYTLFDNNLRTSYFKPLKVMGLSLYLSGHKLKKKQANDKDEYFILASESYRKDLAGVYRKRWPIENLFAMLKSRGFNIESCRVNHSKRIKTLLYVLAIALIWAVKTGQWLIKNDKLIPLKTFKDKTQQKLKSVFRWGLDHIQNILLNNLDFHPIVNLCRV